MILDTATAAPGASLVIANGAANKFSSVEATRTTGRATRRLKVLLLADDLPIGAVRDHIDAITQNSRHRIVVVNPIKLRLGWWAKLVDFDAILIHYSICILFDYFVPPAVRELIRDFRGPKIQIIQDECRWVDRMAGTIADLGIGAVFSSLDLETLPRVYHHKELNHVLFYSSLPGYLGGRYLTLNPPTIAERRLHVIYRGQQLPPWYGRGAKEKHQIGEQATRMAAEHGLAADIKTREDDRIFGDPWIRFLISGKAVLGVEGGVSVFDFDGSIERAAKEFAAAAPSATWDDIWERAVHPHDGNIIHRTITPRIFESILCRTALVLYPGHFRGLLHPWEHYIPLQRDGSNEAEVARCLRDDLYLQDLADRTYAHIINNPRLHFSTYVAAIDSVFDDLNTHHARAEVTPLLNGARRRFRSAIANIAKHLEVLQDWSEKRQLLELLKPRHLIFAALTKMIRTTVPEEYQSHVWKILRMVASPFTRRLTS